MPVGYVGPNGQWVTAADVPAAAATATPVVITAAQQAAPTADLLANIWCTYQLDVSPFTRYRSNGVALVGVGA